MLMCLEERVRYLEMIKVYESTPADLIQGHMDTFHEPFKRAVSSHPPIPETPVLKNAEPCLETEATGLEKDTEDMSKIRRNKESELTIKSALSAAFAKYADKFGKKSNNSCPGKKGGETSATKSWSMFVVCGYNFVYEENPSHRIHFVS
ncbi:hypothetical protein Dsin_032578 [Dipteronia sinensis]|uniref:Uncharacterized protein n=1 Tax=Dipteronia sinensis TaxID=43782 RepID=A0AAD9Z5X8_9ROSI|nr:hypothetical protein Dsin_032578 [Dipteronia sinensis]